MDPITQQAVLATAGAAAGGDKVYVDDVFSTYLVDGANGQTITNGIDLATEGGMIWSKARSGSVSYAVHDTERGINKFLSTNSNNPQIDVSGAVTGPHTITSFNTDGFTTGSDNAYGYTDLSGYGDYVHWTFRKAPGFFDIVTWTGNSVSGRQIAHNLGSAPGFIMVKSYVAGTGGTGWMCYHRSLGNTKAIRLDTTSAATSASSAYWNNTDPTSTHFTVGNNEDINTSANSRSYVAYVFAHDDQTFGTGGNESIIKCGTYTGNGSTTGPVINLGFEPQWVMIRRTDVGDAWQIYDSMRGLENVLRAESTNAEVSNVNFKINLLANGFQPAANDNGHNASGGTYTYIAIRRPHKPPEVGTDVFKAILHQSESALSVGFPPDIVLTTYSNYTSNNYLTTRLTNKSLYPDVDNAEGDHRTYIKFSGQDNYEYGGWLGSSFPTINWCFKRAPGFFDLVAYTGTGANQTCNHNLGKTPQFVIIKNRDSSTNGDWLCWHEDLTETNPYIFLNSNAAEGPFGGVWINPSSTGLNLGSAPSHTFYNDNNVSFIAYLFATQPGISKVSSYTGTGNAINVNCGFSAGARFVLIKRTDSTGDWYIWDSTRGIVSGNDPYILLNDNVTPVTNTDYIDPLSSGFTVTSSAPDALNASGGTYIFLAIA